MVENRNEEMCMKTHDFWYDLPEELIAQTPLEKRDASRLLVLNREDGSFEKREKHGIELYLKSLLG